MQETPKWQRSGLAHGVLYMVIHFKRLACSGRRHRYSHHRSPIYRRYTSIMKCITGTTGRFSQTDLTLVGPVDTDTHSRLLILSVHSFSMLILSYVIPAYSCFFTSS